MALRFIARTLLLVPLLAACVQFSVDWSGSVAAVAEAPLFSAIAAALGMGAASLANGVTMVMSASLFTGTLAMFTGGERCGFWIAVPYLLAMVGLVRLPLSESLEYDSSKLPAFTASVGLFGGLLLLLASAGVQAATEQSAAQAEKKRN